ncbi:MAG: 50S ribosomal protein L4 [Chloroflexi bacterium]|nr:50S ribosomal protein L4 [Chloroflexota bacterium]
MQVPVYTLKGEVAENIELSDDVFGAPPNNGLVHQAVVRQRANRRQGTSQTKTRSTVSGSSKKLHAQKHTGRARRGDITSPTLSGGAVAFGPHPRDYRQAMPKKMRRLALRCALSAKAGVGELKVVDSMELGGGRTGDLAVALSALGVSGTVLIATEQVEPSVVRSARNLQQVDTTPAALLNVADVMAHRTLLMTVGAVRKAEQLWKPVKAGEAAAESGKGR